MAAEGGIVGIVKKYGGQPYTRFPSLSSKMRRHNVTTWFNFNEAWSSETAFDIASGKMVTNGGTDTAPHRNLKWGSDASQSAYLALNSGNGYGGHPNYENGYVILLHGFTRGNATGQQRPIHLGTSANSTRHVWEFADERLKCFDGATGSWKAVDGFQPGTVADVFKANQTMNIAIVYDGNTTFRCGVYYVGSPFPASPYNKEYFFRDGVTTGNVTDLTSEVWLFARNGGSDALTDWSVEQVMLLRTVWTAGTIEAWCRDPYGFWEESIYPLDTPIGYEGAAAGGDHTVNLPALQLDCDPIAPQVTVQTSSTINLPAVLFDYDPVAPTVTTDTGATINLPALQFDYDPTAPTINVPIQNTVLLANAVELNWDPIAPTVSAPVKNTVNLPALQLDYDPVAPEVISGADQTINVPTLQLDYDPVAPTVIATKTETVNLPALQLDYDPVAPTVIGESDLPPTITVPTLDQTYEFGSSGILPAPPHDVGTGTNPTWSLPVDNFGNQPGVTTWSINATTGDITYQINQLSTDANQQALNTKGPYSVTRRLTTSVDFVNETFDVRVNVGDRTIQMTPGTPCVTWTTKLAAARGLEPTKDPSNRVTQTYTVT